jgi:hypothetical protein
MGTLLIIALAIAGVGLALFIASLIMLVFEQVQNTDYSSEFDLTEYRDLDEINDIDRI